MTAAMAPSDAAPVRLAPGLRAQPLHETDIAGATLLSQEAGWNQVAADWRVLLELGSGIGLRDAAGRLIATAITLPYGERVAWISMVLVSARRRRQGIGTWLLRQCRASVLARGLVPILDATPQGRLVYLGLGFEDAWSMRRLVARDNPPEDNAPEDNVPEDGRVAAADVTIRRLRSDDWPELEKYDRAVFGADRSPLLRHLAGRLPAAALIADRGRQTAGFLLGRDGRVATQLGPLAAEDEGVARALLAAAIARVRAPLAFDLPERHAALGAWLARRGFVAERPWTRMVYRRRAAFDDAARMFATAGPELG
jgi:GNAT superfamily N-acetyltransferase